MLNRKIPFGYSMENGKITVNSSEVLAVLTIFSQYLAGESLKSIASQMKVPYRNDAMIWNKNMVKRILENEKYLGKDGFPQLISEEIFQAVNQKRVKKATSLCVIPRELQEIRNLTFCEECGRRLFRKGGNTHSERWD
ncbi:MAG: recombinase family protein [Oscillospiraceae bacterium]|nr:recombinase family protein [Oscillospiraceae bacterium]